MNTALIKRDLLESLKADTEYRHAWNAENVYTSVCFQLRALREQRDWSQGTLGKAAKMAAERISILEDPNADTKPTLNTLLRIANACDVGLDVRFVPYGTVIDRSTKTSAKELEVPSFDQELPELETSISTEAKRRDAAVERSVANMYGHGPDAVGAGSVATLYHFPSVISTHENRSSRKRNRKFAQTKGTEEHGRKQARADYGCRSATPGFASGASALSAVAI